MLRPKILTIPDDQFKGIRLQKTGGDTTVFRNRTPAKWQIKEPKPLPADQDSVSSLVSTLSSLTSDRLIEDKASDLAQYGLASPSIEVAVTKKDGKTEDAAAGRRYPTGGGEFAMLKSDPRVFTRCQLREVERRQDFEGPARQAAAHFRLRQADARRAAGQGPEVEFGKNNQNEWQILKPKPLRADGSQVEDLIRKLKDAKMDTAVSDEDAKKAAAALRRERRWAWPRSPTRRQSDHRSARREGQGQDLLRQEFGGRGRFTK